MPESINKLRIFFASPSDVRLERECFPAILKRLNHGVAAQKGIVLEPVMWETHAWPGFAKDPQKVINQQIGDYDIFIGVMWNRLGTPTSDAQSGTVEEFRNAYELWKKRKCPKLFFYFNQTPVSIDTIEELKEKERVLQFKHTLEKLGGLYWTYEGVEDFKEKIFDHLTKELLQITICKDLSGEESKSYEICFAFRDIHGDEIELLRVPNRLSTYSSFQPTEAIPFIRMNISTTVGYIEGEEIENNIFIIRDPIRPYVIQVGKTRAIRKKGNPEAIPELAGLELAEIKSMYPFIQGEKYRWLRMVLAELTLNPEILKFLGESDPDKEIRRIAANNPSAPEPLQQKQCLFCNPTFRELRRIEKACSQKTIIIRNDFPYGPYFHYIAMPSDPIHSWEEIHEDHLRDMNLQIWRFLNAEKDAGRLVSAGVHIGFNSTIRHLVIGTRTRSSAGASIAHVHKQIWGMAPGSVNIGDYLSSICSAYIDNKPSVDYLESYLNTLRKAGYVIWEDEQVALYVPIGQISIHELQIMVKKEKHNFLELNEKEIESLSRAEFYVTQLYKKIPITSFNEILITEPFGKKTNGFRLIMSFITREVDLAVSELNHLFVVDKHPADTLAQIYKYKSFVISGSSSWALK